jgi:murein DD-endopeptidase MepM/ murein hydrolase activator NlpD
LRRRGVSPREGKTNAARRVLAVLAICAWAALWCWPAGVSVVAAAPPDPLPVTETEPPAATGPEMDASDESATSQPASTESVAVPPDDVLAVMSTGPEEASFAGGEERAPADMGSDSVRPRGLEAPVELSAPPAEPAAAIEDEPGDGPVAEIKQGDKASKDSKKKSDDKSDSDPKELRQTTQDERVWPITRDSYSFSQAFGCTQQLGNLYFADPGCPASAPVVHTGIDMAAPEGTLFYAAASGWVTLAGFDRPTDDANTRIIIQHVGRNEHYSTEYLHWVASFVAVGDYVEAGDPIGEVGNVGYSTGPHLHFSVVDLISGEHVDPVGWLPEESESEAYRGQLPSAEFRLPPGTTWGQPESADPAPPPPPAREDVPDAPPADEVKSERRDRDKGNKKEGRKDSKSQAGEERGKRKDKRAKTEKDPAAETDAPKERTRKRERNKDGTDTEHSVSGSDGSASDTADTSTGKKRRNTDIDEGRGDDSTRERKSDRRNEERGKSGDDGGGGGGNNDKDRRDAGKDKQENDGGSRRDDRGGRNDTSAGDGGGKDDARKRKDAKQDVSAEEITPGESAETTSDTEVADAASDLAGESETTRRGDRRRDRAH